MSPSFVFKPEIGEVKSNGQTQIEVVYVPDGKKTYDSVFVDLLIEDGKD